MITIMKKKYVWMLAAILVICGVTIASVSLSSCEKANAQSDNPAPQVVSTELIRTSQSCCLTTSRAARSWWP